MKTLRPCPLVLLIIFKNILMPINALVGASTIRPTQTAPTGISTRYARPDTGTPASPTRSSGTWET